MWGKPLTQITQAEIRKLIAERRTEDQQLEFKRTLSSKKPEGDRWLSGATELGNAAKEAIAEEIVGFANTYGGTLILGIEENDQKSATGEFPLPRCKALADVLQRSLIAIIEPKLIDLQAVGIEIDGENGFVVISVGASDQAPHCSGHNWRSYKRIGDQCLPMTMRDVQEAAVSQWRNRQETRSRLSASVLDFERHLEFEAGQADGQNRRILLWRAGVRFAALPVSGIFRKDVASRLCFRLPDVTLVEPLSTLEGNRQPNVWHKPSCNLAWSPMLQGIRSRIEDADGFHSEQREIHADGLIELQAIRSEEMDAYGYGAAKRLHVLRLLCPIAKGLVMCAVFRRLIRLQSLPYTIQVEWQVPKTINLLRPTAQHLPRLIAQEEKNTIGNLLLTDEESIHDLWSELQHEFLHSFGQPGADLFPINFKAAIDQVFETAVAQSGGL
jgi:Putative DNA-binding domain